MSAREVVEWVFDTLPPSGARRGGDPASHVFPASLRTFVREVVQNACDQKIVGGSPEVHFRFHELEGRDLETFQQAMSWDTLRPHLESAARARGGQSIQLSLAEFDKRQRLLVLEIEDRDTVGLTGDELTGESHFRALCKDTLYSHKQTTSAGGSYGLGKSVLWGFSAFSTVLFNSQLSIELDGQDSPRLIGRAELPTHDSQSETFAGSGWFGRKAKQRAESLWGARAAERAGDLRMARTSGTSGTSILVVGFRDPTGDGDRSVSDLSSGIRDAIEREFWPALIMPQSPLVLWVGGGKKPGRFAEREFKAAAPLVACYRQRESDQVTLREPGDVVSRDVEVEIPARRDGVFAATKGKVRLSVRLCDGTEDGALRGQVAMFRGPGMVVRYRDHSSLAAASRPFHAVLACGEARDPEAPLLSDRAIERFLRAAEPPGHDCWETTATLKADYERGYAKALEQLEKRVAAELKAIVIEQPSHGQRGPERLRRRFPIGTKGGGGSNAPAFHFSRLDAHYEAGRWHFRGEIRPSMQIDSWTCEVRIAEVGEDGSEIAPLEIESIELGGEGRCELHHGYALVHTTASRLAIRGTSQGTCTGQRAVTLKLLGRSEVTRVQ